MSSSPPASHTVHVFMRIEGEDEIMVGTARSAADVPKLLRAIADEWHRKILVAPADSLVLATKHESVTLVSE